MSKEKDKLIPVSVLLSGRTYRIRVEPHLEEQLRKTAKLINDKVMEFKTSFPGKDMQDYTSMALLWYATQPMAHAANILNYQSAQENLEKMQELLDKTLN
jgi:cell division protein ZapA (FtsZ GTPase activity inhibitor)